MNKQSVVSVGDIKIGNELPFTLIAGPCMLESRDHVLKMVDIISEISQKVGRKFIFKTSFDKANRTSINGKRGVGFSEGLKIFREIKEDYDCPILTDVHETYQCNELKEVVDVMQIPAFLCRQTDLLIAVAKTGKCVHVKKAQFLAPWDMKNVCEKISKSGNDRILLCERGACFGYNRLVSDFRSLPIMGDFGYPVIFDATHSVQEPGGMGTASGGNRRFVEHLARAAMAVSCAGLFIETHDDPDNAFSDGPNMLPVQRLYDFWMRMIEFDNLSKKNPCFNIL